MTFKTVLSIVGVNQPDRDLKETMALCSRARAHLSVLVVSLAAPPPIGEFAAALVEDWAAEREGDLRKLRARGEQIGKLLAEADLSADLSLRYCEVPEADEVTGERARYADITVIGPDLLKDGVLARNVIYGGLFASGRPLLAVPGPSGLSFAPKRVVVAWNSGVEAARAVREALGLLAGAESVSVTMIDPVAEAGRNGPEPGADIAAYLARHGVRVTVDRLPSGGRTVAAALRQHANDFAADMIVMGAYGHSRLRQRLFGGTTQSMLEDAELPLFIAR